MPAIGLTVVCVIPGSSRWSIASGDKHRRDGECDGSGEPQKSVQDGIFIATSKG